MKHRPSSDLFKHKNRSPPAVIGCYLEVGPFHLSILLPCLIPTEVIGVSGAI